MKLFSTLPWAKITIALAIVLIMLGIGGISFVYHSDRRQADSLSAYAHIDFRSAPNEKGIPESATLTLVDYCYSSSQLSSKVTLLLDGIPWDISAITKHTPPTYSLREYNPDTSFKNTNKFFIEIPADAIPDIRTAERIRVRYSYENGRTIDLPLNDDDLAYWKEQVKLPPGTKK